ncbi:MAG: hypothetical protein JW850_23300 [Thermoflexales bacterium]|nr:hypothetical protein [Thermoflexales bacterium]
MKTRSGFILWRALVLAALLGGLIDPSGARAQGNAIRFERISVEEGLSEGAVLAILQDSAGYMWFGTRDGLNRYDGYSFTVYRQDQDPTSLSNSFITALYQDRAGVIWVGTFHGGLNRFDPRTGTFTHYTHQPGDPNSLSHNRVRAIYEDGDGVLWIGTQGGGLNRFDRASGAFTAFRHDPNDPASLADDTVRAICQDSSGMLWVGTYGGLSKFDRATRTFSNYRNDPDDPASLGGNYVLAIVEDKTGALWVGSSDGGLDSLDRSTGRFVHYRHDPADPGSLSNDEINTLYLDPDGVLWIGTESGGLNKLQPGILAGPATTFVHYMNQDFNPHSLSSNAVRAIFQDRSGVLWVGTYGGGLNKLNPNAETFGHYQREPGNPNSLSHNNVWALQEDAGGALWVGTLGGGLNHLDRSTGKWTHYRHDPADPHSLSDDRARALLIDRSGVLWVGTDDGVLNRLDRAGGSFDHFEPDPNDPQRLGGNQIMAIAEDLDGYLWIGTYGAGLNKLDKTTGHVTRYRHDPANAQTLSNDAVLTIYVDRRGDVWIGTESGGLNHFDQATGVFSRFMHDPADPHSISYNGVVSILEDEAGHLWVGTIGGGLDKLDRAGGAFSHYGAAEGLPSDRIYAILPDNAYLWLSTSNGLARFDPLTGHSRHYAARNGLQSNTFNGTAAFASKSGELFFGGVNGFNAFYPRYLKENIIPPPVAIMAFKKFNETVRTDLADGERLALSYRDNFIAFEFAALDFIAPERNQYAYKLEGFDQEWVYAGTRHYASYTNLRGGDYVFRLKAANNEGLWNEQGMAVRLAVTPPVWERRWFQALAALAVVAGLAAAYGWRVSSMRARSLELERQVQQRTAELRQEIEQRQRAEQTLAQQAAGAAVAAERNRLARDLHDAVSQTLFSASLIADVLPRLWERHPDQARPRLEELRQLTRGALAEMRTLLIELRPATLTEAALGDLLKHLSEALTARARIPVILTVEGQEPELPPDVKIALYRIAQEALNNMARHSAASRSKVDLRFQAGQLQLAITDDGRGFDPDSVPPGHLGVSIMRERAESVGARLMIVSEPGKGTQVSVVWE